MVFSSASQSFLSELATYGPLSTSASSSSSRNFHSSKLSYSSSSSFSLQDQCSLSRCCSLAPLISVVSLPRPVDRYMSKIFQNISSPFFFFFFLSFTEQEEQIVKNRSFIKSKQFPGRSEGETRRSSGSRKESERKKDALIKFHLHRSILDHSSQVRAAAGRRARRKDKRTKKICPPISSDGLFFGSRRFLNNYSKFRPQETISYSLID